MSFYELPAGGTGAGSQPPEMDGAELSLPEMPGEMFTYAMPQIPEPAEVTGQEAALAVLTQLQQALVAYRVDDLEWTLDITGLDEHNLTLLDQVLGSGEVSIRYQHQMQAEIQESVLAGVWRICYLDRAGRRYKESLEVAAIPGLIRSGTFVGSAARATPPRGALPEGVLNAPPLLTELNDQIVRFKPGALPHVINLTLLPQSEADLEYLSQALGSGTVTILSRGYGNCRITSTDTQQVWWVQYFNSQDANILNTLEVTDVPAVACAAPEDIRDSAERLAEILEIYQ